MSSYEDVLNLPEAWWPGMGKPASFGREAIERFQKQIDEITGTRDGLSLMKLEWAPQVMKWRPHPLTETGEGYNFPVFLALWDSDGREVAAPRWVLMERVEPDQYLDDWESSRWAMVGDQMWDAKGPAPENGYYVPLWRHIIHEPQRGCCLIQPDGADCWGNYIKPNEDLLARIQKCASKARNDKDVQPLTPSHLFRSPNAQREVLTNLQTAEAKKTAMLDQVFIDADKKRRKQTSYSIGAEHSGIITLD